MRNISETRPGSSQVEAAESVRPPRVLIQQTCIPHYRQRLFQILTQQQSVLFTCIADLNWIGSFLRLVDKDSDHGIRVQAAKTWCFRLPFRKNLIFQPGAVIYALRERPDAMVVEGSAYSLTAWILALYGRMSRVPVLFWGHGIKEHERGPKSWLRKLFYHLPAAHLLYSDYAKKLLTETGLSPRLLHVVHNSLDYDKQKEIDRQITSEEITLWRGSLDVAEGEGLVIFTGRLQPAKRLDLLLRAIGNLQRRGSRAHAALVGDGSEKSALMRLAAEEGISDQIHFLGPVYDEQRIGLFLAASDLAVIPSGAGLSVMHAMAFGTPVLIHDAKAKHGPEWEAVQEGVTGFYYRYNDLIDLTAKLNQAIFPTPRKPAMEEACRRIIRQCYNPHMHAEKFIQAVQQSLKS